VIESGEYYSKIQYPSLFIMKRRIEKKADLIYDHQNISFTIDNPLKWSG